MMEGEMATTEITEEHAVKVLEVVDAGLISGLGKPMPGEMCVEAAVCYALGLPHGDNPACVSPALIALKIRLNDTFWSSKSARASGLRRLAVAQLGSAGVLDEREFVRRVVDYAIRTSAPKALRSAAAMVGNWRCEALIAAASQCEINGSREDAAAAEAAAREAAAREAAARAAAAATEYAEYAAEYAAAAVRAAAAARDLSLDEYAEAIVQILIAMRAPGCKWLALTEAHR
jgi:hypothetical protein